MLTWFDSDCLVIFWSLYFLSALQSDNNNNMFLGMNMFWALILTAHFNPHLTAKMSLSNIQNIFILLEHKLYCFIMVFMSCYSPCSVDGEGVSVFI